MILRLRPYTPKTSPEGSGVHRGGRILGNVFLVIGILCLAVWCFSYFSREIFQAWDSWQFDHSAVTSQESRSSAEGTSPSDPAILSGPNRQNPSDLARAPGKIDSARTAPGDATIGRISIPRLRLTAMVREGVDDWTLNRAVGHIPSTPLPGEVGNVAVAGHRDTFFRGLKDLNVNDTIYFTTSSGDYEYQVESLKIVEPENVGVLAPDGTNSLTIVTCYPFHYIGNAPKRFIARARQIGKQVASR